MNSPDTPENRQKWLIRVPKAFLARNDLNPSDKLVAQALVSYADPRGFAFPTTPQLSAATALHPETVDASLHRLRNRGVITWKLWKDIHGQRRRRFNLTSASKDRLFVPPYDGLGGAKKDGRRTMQFHEPP